jgi:hypothetical protein
LYLLSLGDEMARPHKRRRAGIGNVNRCTCKAMRAMGVACKRPASPATVKKDGEDEVGGVLFVQQLEQRNRLELLPVLRMCVCANQCVKAVQIKCDS